MSWAVVACDAGHKSPMPVARFVRDEAGVWRSGTSGPSVESRDRVRLRCPWCRERVEIRGRRLARLLSKGRPLTLADLTAKRRRR